MQFGFGRIPVSAAPETPCGTNTSSPEILLPPFSEETSAHLLCHKQDIASTEYGVSPAAITSSPAQIC